MPPIPSTLSLPLFVSLISCLASSCTALHILTFGDSLTKGCCTVPRGPDWPGAYHPYSIRLLELLKQKFPEAQVSGGTGG